MSKAAEAASPAIVPGVLLDADGEVVTNPWIDLADDAETPASATSLIVSFKRWRGEGAALEAAGHRLGVRIPNTEDADALAPELLTRPVLALEFPRSGDGRAFSQARVLRQRHAFAGELRAVGDVLIDQLQALRRCGFDRFHLRSDQPLDAARHVLRDFTLAYQTGARAPEADLPLVFRLRRAQA